MAKARYKLWDKISPIYTPGRDSAGKSVFTAEEWMERYPWSAIDGVKVIVSNATINGGVCMNFEDAISFYEGMGMVLEDGATDDEKLATLESFEDSLKTSTPSAEERIAAALEFQNVLNLPDEV